MAVARNKELRGPRNKQKRKTPTRALLFNASSKRKLSVLGKKLKTGRVGTVSHYVTRARALKQLQISLKDFRRLCILKGVYPREPPKKFAGGAKTYYAAKDVAFLAHEPLLAKFREHKSFMKRVKRLVGRREHDEAKRMLEKYPKSFSLDHLVRERYPTFESALSDLDDALALVNLFAWLPSEPGVSSQHHATTCSRLVKEWSFLVSKTQSLRKVFCSIKGMYFQAEFRGIPITWLVPHKFAPDIPKQHVDFKIMKTFLDFSETLLSFVMYKLYAEDLGSTYPPRIVPQQEDQGAFLSSVEMAEGNEARGGVSATNNASSLARAAEMAAAAAQRALIEQGDEVNAAMVQEEESSSSSGIGKSIHDDDDFGQDETVKLLRENERSADRLTSLFRNLVFFLSREVPFETLELCIVSFGGVVVHNSTSLDVNDSRITHVVTDRPGWKMDQGSMEFVQPQWVFDCINSTMLLPVSQYRPEKPLPPHLSPFVDDDQTGYRPARADEIENLKKARAGAGGTEALLSARGEMPVVVQEEIVESEEEEDNTSEASEEEEEEQDEEEEDEEPFQPPKHASRQQQQQQQHHPHDDDFMESATWNGPREGYFFRRGALGTGYYRDVTSMKKVGRINPDKLIKTYAKQEKDKEEEQAKEMRTILMSKKSKKLFDRMQHGIRNKKEHVEVLKDKRRKLDAGQ